MSLSTTTGTTTSRSSRTGGWGRLILTRLGFLVAALFGVMTLSFLLVSITPGDPAQVIAGPMASQSQVDAVSAELGLDKPVHERYVDYIGGLVQGDLGESYYSKRSVASEIADKLPATLSLVGLSVILATVLGVAAGS